MLIAADTHTHTLASTHAYSTILEISGAASEKGLTAVAITDHTPFSEDAAHLWHFTNMKRVVPRELNGVKMIFGAEASIISYDGKINFDNGNASGMDWIIASIHGNLIYPAPEEEITRLYLGVCENPYVDAIGHPALPAFEFNHEVCVKKIKECGKFLEINENYMKDRGGRRIYSELIRLCKKYEVITTISSDSHFCQSVGVTPECEKLIEELDFPKSLIINSDWDRLKEHINKKRGNIF